MQYKASSPEEYMAQLPEERQIVIDKIRTQIKNNLPQGFEEQISYGMLGFVVPHSVYPDGYHCDPKLPLPFINLASQKIMSPYIIQAFTPIKICMIGSLPNILNTAKED